jgi:hypothetical protein
MDDPKVVALLAAPGPVMVKAAGAAQTSMVYAIVVNAVLQIFL